MPKDAKKKRSFGMTDVYVSAVLIVCYLALDCVYPLVQFTLGIQLSDWWLAANVMIALVELVCLMVIKINKDGKPVSYETKQTLALLTQVVGALAGASIQIPSMTSGERGERPQWPAADEGDVDDMFDDGADDEPEPIGDGEPEEDE